MQEWSEHIRIWVSVSGAVCIHSWKPENGKAPNGKTVSETQSNPRQVVGELGNGKKVRWHLIVQNYPVHDHQARQQTAVKSCFSSSMEASSQQQIKQSNKAFCRRSWTLLLHDCFLSCRATINPLCSPLSLSFHLIYIPLSSTPLPAAAFEFISAFLQIFFLLSSVLSRQLMHSKRWLLSLCGVFSMDSLSDKRAELDIFCVKLNFWSLCWLHEPHFLSNQWRNPVNYLPLW